MIKKLGSNVEADSTSALKSLVSKVNNFDASKGKPLFSERDLAEIIKIVTNVSLPALVRYNTTKLLWKVSFRINLLILFLIEFPDYKKIMINNKIFPVLYPQLKVDSLEEVTLGCIANILFRIKQLFYFCIECDEAKQHFIDTKGLDYISPMVYHSNAKMKIGAYQVLQNLSKDCHNGRLYIMDYHTIFSDSIQHFNEKENMNLVSASGSFLRNMTVDKELVHTFKDMKLYDNLINNYFDNEEEAVRLSVFPIIANLVRDQDTAIKLLDIIDKVIKILENSENEKILAATAQIVRNASDDNEVFRKKILIKGGLKPLVELCVNYSDPEIQENAVCAIRNLCANDPLMQEKVTNIAGIQAIVNLLKSPRVSVQAYGAWAIRAISSSDDNVHKIVVFKGLEPIIHLCNSSEKGVYEHAIVALLNITKSTDLVKSKVMEYNGIPPVLQLCENADKEVQANAIKTLYYLCQSGEVLANIKSRNIRDKLLKIKNDSVKDMIKSIIELL